MAAIDFDYSVDVDSTDRQGGGGLLPKMNALIWAEAIEFPETDDKKGRRANITFEVQEPEEFKGRKFWSNWVMLHADGKQNKSYSFGKHKFDCFARAVQVFIENGTDSDELLFKSFVVEIGVQIGNAVAGKPGEFYKDKNQIEKFYYSDDQAKEPVPELGVIGDGTVAPKATKKPASNDNKAPAAKQEAAPAKKLPWGKKAA